MGSISKDTDGADAYGYDSTKKGASPGSLTLSHILPHGVMLPVDSLSKRDRNQLQAAGGGGEGEASWIEAELMLSLLDTLFTVAVCKSNAYT